MNDHTPPTATPLSHTIELQLTGQPPAKNRWGSGSINPTRVLITYLDDRCNAHLYGLWINHEGVQTDEPIDQPYRYDDNWPDWLAARAREHAPATPAPSADRTAVLRDAADVAERVGRRVFSDAPDERRAEGAWETAALLRRMADETQPAQRSTALTAFLAQMEQDRAAQLEAAQTAPEGELRIAASSLASGYLHAAAHAVRAFEGPEAAQAYLRETVAGDTQSAGRADQAQQDGAPS